jgi:2'-5' RNA ligase
MRAFLAVNLDRKVKEELAQIQEELKRKIKGIRWVNAQLLHITLRFLGEIDDDLVAMMEDSLKELGEKTASFRVSLARLGAFPSKKEPRVIWIGMDEGTTELSSLTKEIEENLKNLHPSHPSFYNKDNSGKIKREKFLPHLTIGRRNRNEAFEADASIFNERWECRNRLHVESFHLIRSILRPTGPLYTPLREFLLKKM